MDKPRLGHISYIHSLPQYYPIETGRVGCPAQIVPGLPGELNRKFALGQLEISPVSTFEYLRRKNAVARVRHGPRAAASAWALVPELGLVSNGPAMSVLLAGDRPPEEMSGCRIRVPAHAATTPALLRILLKYCWKAEAKIVSAEAGGPAEAELLIGDDALRAAFDGGARWKHRTDLGEVWKRWTGHKMVYCVGVRQPAFRAAFSTEIMEALAGALLWSRNHLDDIISAGAAQTGLPGAFIGRYFGGLEHTLDSAALEGMRVYEDWLDREGLLDPKEPVFAEDAG